MARKPKETKPESTEPAAPLSELDALKLRVKELEDAEANRELRAKKMKTCLNRIDRAEKALATAEAHLESAKGDAKSAAGELAQALNELKLTAKGLPIQLEMPLDGKSDAKDEKKSDAKPADSTPDGWKNVAVATLGLAPRITKALGENEPPLTTLGDLASWQEKKGDFWQKDLKGIGPEAAEKIGDAMTKFWSENPQYTVATA